MQFSISLNISFGGKVSPGLSLGIHFMIFQAAGTGGRVSKLISHSVSAVGGLPCASTGAPVGGLPCATKVALVGGLPSACKGAVATCCGGRSSTSDKISELVASFPGSLLLEGTSNDFFNELLHSPLSRPPYRPKNNNTNLTEHHDRLLSSLTNFQRPNCKQNFNNKMSGMK
ncbi:hypothetical protein KC19_1G109400 [Ceratodon purpureus]|uniref:Uncharacterized protein n=1 Tax=Ceratodon purpureus TaxID=3225 RepID=A0A8T0J6E3_CERPU|nr:hypothetical protein KC19_1G109400 [Ceratodon purpureus]